MSLAGIPEAIGMEFLLRFTGMRMSAASHSSHECIKGTSVRLLRPVTFEPPCEMTNWQHSA